MNIMVFDVPAEYGGALSILNEFYNKVKEHHDKSINWIFILSTPVLEETSNIKVLRFPWIKKSWWHRLYFDHFIAPRLVKKYKVDKIFSLQNIIVPHTNISQTLYVHQPLPFVDYKFTFKENRVFWVYQNIIGRNIIKSIQRANKVIVQTEWLKEICATKSGVETEKIVVIPPEVNVNINDFFKPSKESLSTFFYPASGLTYKNHSIIVEACKVLKENGFEDFKVIFTLTGDENKHISNLYKEVKGKQLPIEFIGSISREQVFDLYTKSVLLFPSYIETFGLPMLEAKLHKGIILASDCPFSHEILDGYENAYFFDAFDRDGLVYLFKEILNHETNYVKENNYNYIENILSWDELLNILIKMEDSK